MKKFFTALRNIFRDILGIWIIANIEYVVLFGVIIFLGLQMVQHPKEAGSLIPLCLVAAIPATPSKNLTETCAKVFFFFVISLGMLYHLYTIDVISKFTLIFILALTFFLTSWNSVYTYQHIDQVISRSMRYRYTGVDLMTYKFKFILDRFIVVFTILISVFTILVFYLNLEEFKVKSKSHEVVSVL